MKTPKNIALWPQPTNKNQGRVFGEYHPSVNFLYFVLVFCFAMFFLHPVCLVLSFSSAFFYSLFLNGKKALFFNLAYMLPLMLVTALLNPVFNHAGGTILFYFANGKPVTAEAAFFGLAAGTMLGAVLVWFSCYNRVLSSDKFIYLFSRIIPRLSLIISMILGFVPKFKKQLTLVTAGQKGLGNNITAGNWKKRLKNGAAIFSILLTWAFENSVETADAMKSKGYGLAGSSSFSIFSFSRRDALVLTSLLFMAIYVVIGAANGVLHVIYFPSFYMAAADAYGISVFVVYGALCFLPLIVEGWEVIKWQAQQKKIILPPQSLKLKG